MEMIFVFCAALGGAALLVQFVLGLLGSAGHSEFGGDHDVGHDIGHDVGHDHGDHHVGHEDSTNWLVGVLTVRTAFAALTFFGLGGWLALSLQEDKSAVLVPVLVALAAGGGAMFLVAWVMRSLARLHSEGNVRIDRAVGKTGTVYLPVPA